MLEKCYVLEDIIKKYQIKNGEKIYSSKVYEIIENTQINLQELKKSFRISSGTYTKLRKGENCYFIAKIDINKTKKQDKKIHYKTIENNFLTKEDKTKIRRNIKKYINNNQTITLEELNNIKENLHYTDYQIKEGLEINPENYKFLKNNKIKNLDIISYKEERKIYFLKFIGLQ